MMTVERLIEKLQSVKDKTQTVEVSVKTSTQRYPVAYCSIYENGFDILKSVGNVHRIEISLPSDNKTFMTVSTRKKQY